MVFTIPKVAAEGAPLVFPMPPPLALWALPELWNAILLQYFPAVDTPEAMVGRHYIRGSFESIPRSKMSGHPPFAA
jgi:hypothetical protein